MGDFSALAIRIKELRTSLNMTQKEFAVFVGCTAATLSAYENGSKSPSLEIVKGIAEKCNVSIDWLCGLSDKKELKPEIKNYKDVVLLIIELLKIKDFNLMAFNHPPYIEMPENLYTFFHDYRELEMNESLKKRVFEVWLSGMLEELAMIPIKDNKTTQGNPTLAP